MALVAEAIAAARASHKPFPVFAESDRPKTEEEGYAIQAQLHPLLADPLVGWKIGCTNPVMQDMLGIPGPAVGGMTTLFNSGVTVPFTDFVAPGVECEIAFQMNGDVPTDVVHTQDTIASFVNAVMVSMEIVDNRYGDIATRPVGEMIADDFFHVACLLGEPNEAWRDIELAGLRGTSEKNGVVQGEGVSKAVQGHPLAALAWAANKLAGQGRGLRDGQVITTGTIAPVLWVDEPGEYAIEVEALGRLTIRFD